MTTPTPPMPAPKRRGLSLQGKLTLVFITLLIAPTLVAWWLVTQISTVTAGFSRNEAEARVVALESSLEAYAELIVAKKQACGAAGKELAHRFGNRTQLGAEDVAAAKTSYPDLHALTLGAAPTQSAGDEPLPAGHRLYDVEMPTASGAQLTARFLVRDWQIEAQSVRVALDQARSATRVRSAMPKSYLYAFWLAVGGAVLIAAIIGAMASRRVAKRAQAVLKTTRAVVAGDMNARTKLGGSDEFRELGDGVDAMLDAMQESQRHIEYLQRINTWQDVARRLAHEIKNPLTPIQLAVQQCVSAYRGDDAAFGKTLGTAQEIVEEEIHSLRRLVDTFRTLGQLPRVVAEPMPLATLLEDVRHIPEFADVLTIEGGLGETWIAADRLMLRRLVANVIENGMQAGRGNGRQGKVVLTTAAVSNQLVQIMVDDEGPGVAEKNRLAIFEPYFTTKKTGTGLGLSIAKTIAIDHGGDLVVAAAPSSLGGARFIITVPSAPAA